MYWYRKLVDEIVFEALSLHVPLRVVYTLIEETLTWFKKALSSGTTIHASQLGSWSLSLVVALCADVQVPVTQVVS